MRYKLMLLNLITPALSTQFRLGKNSEGTPRQKGTSLYVATNNKPEKLNEKRKESQRARCVFFESQQFLSLLFSWQSSFIAYERHFISPEMRSGIGSEPKAIGPGGEPKTDFRSLA
jgi:hypothetical protein